MANIELDGANKKIKVDSGDLTLDVPGDIILDADGGDVVVADGGTNILKVTNSSSDVVLQPQVDAKDIIFKQYDGTTVATVEDNGTFNIPASKLAIGGTAVTSTAAELNILDGVTSTAAELNIMDGVTATAAEINLIDGGTARGTTAIADGDGVLINDAGTMRMTSVETLKTYIGGGNNLPHFYVSIPVGQSLSTGATTLINFSEELVDSGGFYNTSSKQFLPTTAGYYHIYAQATMDTDTDFNQFRIAIRKNGSVIALGGHDNDSRNSVSTSFLVQLDGSDDYIDATAMQNSGGAASLGSGDTETFMFGYKIIT